MPPVIQAHSNHTPIPAVSEGVATNMQVPSINWRGCVAGGHIATMHRGPSTKGAIHRFIKPTISVDTTPPWDHNVGTVMKLKN
eukprot:CAMPEP_0172759618 /NCGR_PEP_ID=MMETSP1074-20121228/168071_1 /TAXON_ID=2916 /ORGANISM="Ceratium fusus, Strain PA161109" /LENGTH=82 /DNA_ID=CAMNT_0013593457 /DNA_START=340 /DNA_END=588 /DNA_ORIENTATION=-